MRPHAETLLIAALIVCLLALIGMTVWGWVG